MNNIAYFDNCATTQVDEDVLDVINSYSRRLFFNPSSRTNASMAVRKDLENARAEIASLLGASPNEIVFTSGGTESDNTAILGAVKSRGGNVVTTASEHSAVYNAVMLLKNRSIDVRIAKTTSDGHIDVDDFLTKVDADTVLCTVMHVNNETGAVNDVRSICSKIKKINPNSFVFSDGVQAVGKIDVNVKVLGVDAYSVSGHKIHCSKGTGCLYVKNGVKVNPLILGGGQESGMRSGTEFVAGQIALATAMKKAVQSVAANTEKFLKFKEILSEGMSKIPHSRVNCTENVSPAVFSVAFEGIKSEVLLRMLEDDGFIVGTGSACSAKNKSSRFIAAIGLDKKYSEGVLRVSFSRENTTEDVRSLAGSLVKNVAELRKIMGVRFN